jgi:hypothetical protein
MLYPSWSMLHHPKPYQIAKKIMSSEIENPGLRGTLKRGRISKVVTLAAAAILVGSFASAQSARYSELEPDATAAAPVAAPFLTGPPKKDGPVVVRARFDLRDINDIDDEAETFEFEGVLTLAWKDPRQAFDPADVGVDEKVFLGEYQFDETFTGWFPQVVLVNASGLYEKHGTVLRVQPDGSLTLVETINAAGEADLDLRRYPFDRQHLDAIFEVLGFDSSEVALQTESEVHRLPNESVRTPQWTLEGVGESTRDRPASYAGHTGVASTFVVTMDVERESFFMVRLVILPLMLIVMLSWSVFWMDRSSVGDRINVSFIGILTVVAYQIVVSEIWPHISYFTLMNGFLNLSFLVMCATVVINLVVAKLDQKGRPAAGDLIDHRCRWMFPLTYFGLLAIMAGVAFVFF